MNSRTKTFIALPLIAVMAVMLVAMLVVLPARSGYADGDGDALPASVPGSKAPPAQSAAPASKPAPSEQPPPSAQAAAETGAPAAEPEPDETVADDGFVVKDCGGKIAVFSPSDPDRPLWSTGIATATLRLADQEALLEGIPVADEEELALLLEDFGS